MTAALFRELVLQERFLFGQTLESIYFGGGTPSLLNHGALAELLDLIDKHYNISENAEITLEANPDDLYKEKLQALHTIGINRLSIGIQSFFDEDLQFMKRIHTASEAQRCIAEAQDAGFSNISIDLIYGTPTMTDAAWLKNIEKALDSQATHLSTYALTVEPKTELHYQIQSKKIPSLDEEKQVRQYALVARITAAEGFVQYEVSNFGKEEYFSRHNTNYWKGLPYLGIGPSAHSFDGRSRQWNVRNNFRYIEALKQDLIPAEKEILSPSDHYNEYIMTGLRTIWGVDLEKIKTVWGAKYHDHLLQEAERFLEQKALLRQDRRLLLSKTHWLYADGIASDLFFTTKKANYSNNGFISADRHL